LGDFGGGGLICAFGILLALIERQKSGRGQVVDAAMVDGAAYLASTMVKAWSVGAWKNDIETTGTNLLDGGAHFYRKCVVAYCLAVIDINNSLLRRNVHLQGWKVYEHWGY